MATTPDPTADQLLDFIRDRLEVTLYPWQEQAVRAWFNGEPYEIRMYGGRSAGRSNLQQAVEQARRGLRAERIILDELPEGTWE